MYNYKYKMSAQCIPRKHKNEHNRQKIGEMPKSIMSKFWSIIDTSVHAYSYITQYTISIIARSLGYKAIADGPVGQVMARTLFLR